MPEAVERPSPARSRGTPADRFATAAELSLALADAASTASARRGRRPCRAASRPPRRPIAVLPFVNMSADPENEYFSDGMTDEIINALAQVPGLRVAARTSCFAFKGKNVDAREVGERLKVRTVLEGSVRKAGNRIRMTAQLINVADGYQLWSDTYERTLADVFALQDELARAIVCELTSRMIETDGRSRGRPRGQRGHGGLHPVPAGLLLPQQADQRGFPGGGRLLSPGDRVRPGICFELRADGLLPCAPGIRPFGAMPPLEAMPRAQGGRYSSPGARSQLAEAHGARAVIAMLYDWDWSLAEREFERAMSLGARSSAFHLWRAIFLMRHGPF